MNDLVRRDEGNAESRSQSGREIERKHVVGTLAIELFSFDGIYMGKDQIDGILGEIIKRRARAYNVSEESVIFFNLCFFMRRTRIAEENTGLLVSLSIIFKSRNDTEPNANGD